MPSVFISYRHENDTHCERVKQMALELESRGAVVVLDVLANEREFDFGGPPDWTVWSMNEAACLDHKVLIVASAGWFRCFEGKEKPGIGIGSATEARAILQRLAKSNFLTMDIRPVVFQEDREIEFPAALAGFPRFAYPARSEWIIKWLQGKNPPQQLPDCSKPTREDTATTKPPPHFPEAKAEGPNPAQGFQRHQTRREVPPDASLSQEADTTSDVTVVPSAILTQAEATAIFSLLGLNWITVKAGPYQRGFTKAMISSVLHQIADPMIDPDSVAGVLEAEPARQINVPEFQIAKELVTNAQFHQFVETSSYRTTAERNGEPESWRSYATPEKSNHPVVQISFEDAQAFCEWAGVRLPNLDEWMKAYRGPNGNIYPWGNQFDASKCNTEENKTVMNTSPVNMFAAYASYYGCYDMIGNVSEWVDAAGDTGPQARNINPAVLEHLKRTRAIMGGAWSLSCQAFGLPLMTMLAPIEKSSNDFGFRVARSFE